MLVSKSAATAATPWILHNALLDTITTCNRCALHATQQQAGPPVPCPSCFTPQHPPTVTGLCPDAHTPYLNIVVAAPGGLLLGWHLQECLQHTQQREVVALWVHKLGTHRGHLLPLVPGGQGRGQGVCGCVCSAQSRCWLSAHAHVAETSYMFAQQHAKHANNELQQCPGKQHPHHVC
jgi:hypothetical protein